MEIKRVDYSKVPREYNTTLDTIWRQSPNFSQGINNSTLHRSTAQCLGRSGGLLGGLLSCAGEIGGRVGVLCSVVLDGGSNGIFGKEGAVNWTKC